MDHYSHLLHQIRSLDLPSSLVTIPSSSSPKDSHPQTGGGDSIHAGVIPQELLYTAAADGLPIEGKIYVEERNE